jgi:hypothetical protein
MMYIFYDVKKKEVLTTLGENWMLELGRRSITLGLATDYNPDGFTLINGVYHDPELELTHFGEENASENTN